MDLSVLFLCSLPATTSCRKDLWRSDNLDCPQKMCFYVEIVSEQQQLLSHFFPSKTNYDLFQRYFLKEYCWWVNYLRVYEFTSMSLCEFFTNGFFSERFLKTDELFEEFGRNFWPFCGIMNVYDMNADAGENEEVWVWVNEFVFLKFV